MAMLFPSPFFTRKKILFKKNKKNNPPVVHRMIKSIFWFILGAVLGLFFFVSFLLIIYQRSNKDLIYSGILVDGHDFSGQTKKNVIDYFTNKNRIIEKDTIEFISSQSIATVSAKQLGFGYDEELLAEQAYSFGHSDNQISNLSIIVQAFFNQIYLPRAYRYSPGNLDQLLEPLKKDIEVQPVNALFTFDNGRVSAFTLSRDGLAVDIDKLKEQVYADLVKFSDKNISGKISIQVPVKTVKPVVTNENVNSYGIRELIGEGTSLFQHSIENRIYNVQLAASRLNGILIAPDEVFSFDKALGDISSFTGYKQAYVIENGHTVLGDGGGVCQVSTTLFRAALKAGLPIVERNQHAYRVGYYEQDSGPGIDAAVYSPSVDLKFKNDTGHYILIQSYTDTANLKLTFDLYGVSDGRVSTIDQPVILSQSPAPDPLYQDDPTLPKGEVKQIDFAAGGANVYFTRTVKKDGKITLSDKFTSNYQPWKAVYLRGTKE